MGGSSDSPWDRSSQRGGADGRKPGGGDGEGGGSSGSNDCVFQFVARIHGPVPGVANLLNVGDLLTVVLIDGPPIQLGLLDESGQQVGSLAGQRELLRMLGCMQTGISYVAEVQSSIGSMISVQVRNA